MTPLRKPFVSLIVGVITATVIGGGLPTVALAHDAWVQAFTPIVEIGTEAHVGIFLGNHSQDHRSFRIAGKWSLEDVELQVIDPTGHSYDATPSLFDTGEADEVGPVGPKGYLAGSFIPVQEGLFTVTARSDRLQDFGDGPFRSLRLAKTVVAGVSDPRFHQVRRVPEPHHLAAADRLEIVPEVNTAALRPGDEVVLALLLKEQPAPDHELSVIHRRSARFEDFRTDAQGRVRFTVQEPGYYLVRAIHEEDADDADDADGEDATRISYEATFTFLVQREPDPSGGLTESRVAWTAIGGIAGVLGLWVGSVLPRRRNKEAHE